MILDTSAIVAISVQESGFEALLARLSASSNAGVGAPTITEAALVLSSRLGLDARGMVSRFLHEGSIETIPFGEAHFGAAVDAWLKYGKGRHPAGLNFGDCLSYAVARLAGEPLLCTGRDFVKTDLLIA